MLLILIGILIIVLIVNTLIKKEELYSPLSIFCLIWSIILSAYSLRILPLYEIDFNVKCVIVVGCIGFILGSLPVNYTLGNYGRNKNENVLSRKVLFRTKLAYFLCSICIAFSAIEAAGNIILLSQGYTFDMISLAGLGFQNNSALWSFMAVFIAYPFSYAILPIGALNFIKSDGDKGLALLSIIIALLRVFHHGGRATLLYFIIYLLLFSEFYGRKMRTRTKALLFAAVIIFIIAILIVSSSRGIENIGESLYLYICGCIPNLSVRIDRIVPGVVTLGGASLYGYILPFMLILNGIGVPYPEAFITLRDAVNVESIVRIGNNIGYNAFVTPFYYLYLDGRFIGVFTGMFILGIVIQKIYKKTKTTQNERLLIIYSLLFFQIVLSMIRLHFATYSYALSFIYVFILYTWRNGSEKQK